MEKAVVAILKVAVVKLRKEISLIRGLDKEAAKLTGSLDTIQKFLNDAEAATIPGEAVKSWLEKLENVVFDADDVLDELNYHNLSKQIKATRSLKEKVLSGFSSPFKHISSSRNMALKIKEINQNLESINKEAADLGLVQKLANEPALVIAANSETDSWTVDPIFIGRDNAASEIIEMLTNSSIRTDERAVSIISIVGMGGLGKTTLIRKVYNNKMVKSRFGAHIWVHVSPNFDPLTLYKKILNKLTSCQVEMADRQDILSKLQEVLKDKTCLLVLDDVWNEDLSKWEDFFNSLLGVTSAKGNAIVVTTRNMEVASTVNTLHIHQLKGLSEEECWSIIRAKAFGKQDAPYEFEAIGRKIARRCQGLPLAANVVGGILRKKSEEKWVSIEQKWLSSYGGGDNITRVLRLSFDNLSPPLLKKCFAYCAMFPKGSKIMKRKLIEFWMAEGFLHADGSDDMESVGENLINVLLHSSLLQADGRDDYGNVESCGMHDLVHDLACSVSSSANNTGGSNRVRYMALGDDYCGDKSSPIPKYLRTLLMTSKVDISNINFSHCESLHVLRLDSEVKVLPSWIQKLIHLRDFDISKTWIEYLPAWIGGFSHLQTLRANSRYLKKLPSSMKYLINLRHLYISEKVELPVGIGRLTSLQTLKYFAVGDKNGCKIEELGSLNNLKGDLQILNLERVHGKEESGKANLFKKSKILNLCLEWDGDREGETNDENVLEGFQPHSNLKKLVISGFNGKRFPLQTLELNKLMSLSLWCCKECEEIPMLGHLPNLKSLCLQGLSNLKCINSAFYGMVNKDTRIVFPALESFKLLLLPKLAVWAEVEVSGASKVKVFPRLQHLVIHDCEQLMSVPNHVSSCLEHLTIHGTGLKFLPTDWLFSNNQTLSELYIRDCPNLKEFRGSFITSQGSFASLWRVVITALVYLPLKLWLKSLSSLKNLPRVFGCLPESLRLKILSIIEIPRFPNLRNVKIDVNIWSIEAVDGILQGCCHSLYSLSLKGMQGWECLPESIQHLTALSELWLNNFGMEELPEWFGNLSSLRFLYLYNCQWLRHLPSMDAMRRLTTLKDLYIRDCPELVIQSEAVDSEWPKVSHIPLITIEGSNYIGGDADPKESEMRKKVV